MTIKAYLTIDDSPSTRTDQLVTYLEENDISALFFCVGKHIEENVSQVVNAVEKGHVLANHSYSHARFSTLDFNACVEEIEKCEKLIDEAYQKVGKGRVGKYFRFPHMDRGAGGWVVDYNQIDESVREDVISLFADGLNITLDPPTDEMMELKHKLQDYLKREGFEQPFENIAHSWFKGTELEEARDCMYTFSNSDWMLLDRHKGKWPYKSLDDLRLKIDDDKYLKMTDSNHIILAHDKREPELFPAFKVTVDHMISKGFEFLAFQ